MQILPVSKIAALFVVVSLVGCQGSDKFLEVADNVNATVSGARFDPTNQEVEQPDPDPDRSAAVAEIRAKASSNMAAQGEFPKIFEVKDSVATDLNAIEEQERIANSVGTAASPTAQYNASVGELDNRAEALRKKADTHYSEAEAEILRIQARQEAERLRAEGTEQSETEVSQ